MNHEIVKFHLLGVYAHISSRLVRVRAHVHRTADLMLSRVEPKSVLFSHRIASHHRITPLLIGPSTGHVVGVSRQTFHPPIILGTLY